MAEEVTLASLQAGLTVAAGTYRITGAEADLTALLTALSEVEVPDDGYAPGSAAVTAGGIMLMCSGDSASNCTVTVHDDDSVTVTGTILVAAADGMFPLTDTQRAEAAVAAQKLATDAAVTKETAIAAEAAQAADDGPGGMDATMDHSIEIGHDGTGATVTIEVAGAAAAAPKFERADVMLDEGRSMHVRAMPADADGNVVEEVIIVATDIEAPKEVPFSEVHTLTVNPDDATPPVNRSLPIDADSLGMMETDGISATGGGTIALLAAVADDPATMEVDETVAAFSTDATFDGAPGTLTCGGDTNCTVTLDAMGDITAVTGGWIFTPDEDAMAVVADADYLRYGFWLKRTTDAGGAVTYNEVETFAGSEAPASGDLAVTDNEVKGTAQYVGKAVGVYAIKHRYSETTGKLTDATSGHFLAQAELEATFGQTDDRNIRPRLLNTLTGTIDQFVLQHGETNDWAVELDGDIDAGTGMVMAGTASDAAEGSDAPDGSFTATFHGSVEESNDVVPQPGSVVGEFNANFQNGAVAGAFGARKEAE